MASMLYAVETSAYGGDTLFANQYVAYESLSERFRQMLGSLVGINYHGHRRVMHRVTLAGDAPC